MNRPSKPALLFTVLAAALSMCGCFSFLQVAKQDETVQSGKRYILTRIRTEFEIAGYESRMQKAKDLQVVFSADSRFPDEGSIFTGFGLLVTSFGEYFILKIPVKYKYIKGISLSLGHNEYARAFMNLSIIPSENNDFLYIGDIVFYIENDKVHVRAEDRYSDIDAGFMQYIKDAKGNYLKPETVLFSPESKAEFGIVRVVTYYRTRFNANGTTTMVPYSVTHTILEL